MCHTEFYPWLGGVLTKFPKDPHRLWVLGIDTGHYMPIAWAFGIKSAQYNAPGRGAEYIPAGHSDPATWTFIMTTQVLFLARCWWIPSNLRMEWNVG